MIQVLGRAFMIVRRLAEEPDRIWTLPELAGIAGVRTDTCCHIAGTLCRYGYLERRGPRQGYRLGPEINGLSGKIVYRRNLALWATPLLEEFFERFRAPVNLACANGGERYLICRAGRMEWKCETPALRYRDMLSTATGLMLAAHYPEKVRKKLLAENPVPEDFPPLPERTTEALAELLTKIRRLSFIEMMDIYNMQKVAFPVPSPDGGVRMSIGCFLPDYRYTNALRRELLPALRRLAGRISARLRREP